MVRGVGNATFRKAHRLPRGGKPRVGEYAPAAGGACATRGGPGARARRGRTSRVRQPALRQVCGGGVRPWGCGCGGGGGVRGGGRGRGGARGPKGGGGGR